MHVYLYKTNSGHHLPAAVPHRQSSSPSSSSRNCSAALSPDERGAESGSESSASSASIRRIMSASTDRDQQQHDRLLLSATRASASSSAPPIIAIAASGDQNLHHNQQLNTLDYRNDPLVYNRYYSQNDLDAATFPGIGRQQERVDNNSNSNCRDYGSSVAINNIAAAANPSMMMNSSSTTLSRCRHANWEACEEQRLRELEEAKTRASQMEKTMKWWSACTANWREKWSRVRDERNRYRNEIGEIRAKLETSQAELIQAQLEKRELLKERKQAQSIIDCLNKELEEVKMGGGGASSSKIVAEDSNTAATVTTRDFACQCYIPERASMTAYYGNSVYGTPPADDISWKTTANSGDEITERNLHALKNRTEDTMRLLMEEREERSKVNKKFSEMESEMKMMRAKCDELEASKQASVEEHEELKSAHAEALHKLKRVRMSPNSFDQYANAFKVDTFDNDDSLTSTSTVYQSAVDQRKEELLSLKKLLHTEQLLDEAMQTEQRLRSDNGHLHEQIVELQTSLQAMKDEGHQWKDECGALRKANDELMSRLGSLEISIISSIEGSDLEKDPSGE